MGESRIEKALARIEAALSRMDVARASLATSPPRNSDDQKGHEAAGTARVMELVNSHEKLREEVADTLRDLDTLIGELES
jgi:hypothetical protein